MRFSLGLLTLIFFLEKPLSAQEVSNELKNCINEYKELGISPDVALSTCQGSRQSSLQSLNPDKKVGEYWVYTKSSDITNAQMETAGAIFYTTVQACNINNEFCSMRDGVWISKKPSLDISPASASSESTVASSATQSSPAISVVVDNSTDAGNELSLAYYRECMDRTMFRTLRTSNRAIAHNGYNDGFRFGRKPSNVSDEQMKAAGLRWAWGYQSWIGPQSEVKIPLLSSAKASKQCRNELQEAGL